VTLEWSSTVICLAVHVGHIASVCFSHLPQLQLVRRSLTTDAAHKLVRALDYCNGLLAGLPVGQMAGLQSVLCTPARYMVQLPSHALVSAIIHD